MKLLNRYLMELKKMSEPYRVKSNGLIYKWMWLEPHNKIHFPVNVFVRTEANGWHGWRRNVSMSAFPETIWLKGLWVECEQPPGMENCRRCNAPVDARDLADRTCRPCLKEIVPRVSDEH